MATIALSRGHVALVDDADLAAVLAVGPWHARPHGRTVYAQHHVWRDGHRTTEQLHQFLLGVTGIDHVNGDGLDNRRRNLRIANQALNSANRGLAACNTSGFKGVTRRRTRWIAQIRTDGMQRYLGTYDTAEQAAHAYDIAAAAAWGEFARLNFPKENAA